MDIVLPDEIANNADVVVVRVIDCFDEIIRKSKMFHYFNRGYCI